ncbi:MAG: hypothetical protein UU49_C0033G0001 [Candidatus Magasanikbacteria bacterium GW2011_GWC2_41_17]|uniref:Uncharacterized protein n=1 Tax=Candidatus Magasanikbacteria bacterium GW2011_GWC2_41_17 TaxID=1619048 RepID=A0A0G0V8J9_9BACT|nr:MAG: hypothetical protein UU49_C0033G0001 [Candidatus Magasanikbacteria bacterium GW2011_GWC2_41_17]
MLQFSAQSESPPTQSGVIIIAIQVIYSYFHKDTIQHAANLVKLNQLFLSLPSSFSLLIF